MAAAIRSGAYFQSKANWLANAQIASPESSGWARAEPTFRATADLGHRLCSPERRVRVVEVLDQSSDTRNQVEAEPLSDDLVDTVLGRPLFQPARCSDIGENCSAEFLVHHAEIMA